MAFLVSWEDICVGQGCASDALGSTKQNMSVEGWVKVEVEVKGKQDRLAVEI